jgi:endonuclease/exonuclease/phosphatase family metal-dependent hydrolase
MNCFGLFVCLWLLAGVQDDVGAPGHRYGQETAPERTSGTIRIASYNVLNYFDDVDDPALQGEWDDKDLASSSQQLEAVARAIRELDADVLALQEVESREALIRFRDAYLGDMGYDHVASLDAGYYRGVEQSVLSRIPVTAIRNWPGLSTEVPTLHDPGSRDAAVAKGYRPIPENPELTFQRSPLMVDFRTTAGYEFTLFVVHLKAGGLSSAYRREAEGQKLLELVAERTAKDPSRNVIVLGDFNAKHSYKSMRLLVEGGLIDSMHHRATEPGDLDRDLWITHESGRILDYILLNRPACNEFVPGSAFVLGTLHPGDDYDWRKDEPPAGHAADHYPVAIELVPRDGS